ncbi:type II toxin-antitoxin system RelE/ParE family toxin [bacterium]|nr:type II toxin-antitoxin system RelE/ParE family toxin [bacterium]
MPQSYEVMLSAEAGRNIEEAFHWIAEDDIKAAELWYEGLMGALRTLSKFPLRCPISPETRIDLVDREIRQFLYGRGYWKYRVLFAVEGDQVLIAHVRHGARLYRGEQESDRD